eukprot:Colp12_sorted_trinity150504_noHs@326
MKPFHSFGSSFQILRPMRRFRRESTKLMSLGHKLRDWRIVRMERMGRGWWSTSCWSTVASTSCVKMLLYPKHRLPAATTFSSLASVFAGSMRCRVTSSSDGLTLPPASTLLIATATSLGPREMIFGSTITTSRFSMPPSTGTKMRASGSLVSYSCFTTRTRARDGTPLTTYAPFSASLSMMTLTTGSAPSAYVVSSCSSSADSVVTARTQPSTSRVITACTSLLACGYTSSSEPSRAGFRAESARKSRRYCSMASDVHPRSFLSASPSTSIPSGLGSSWSSSSISPGGAGWLRTCRFERAKFSIVLPNAALWFRNSSLAIWIAGVRMAASECVV